MLQRSWIGRLLDWFGKGFNRWTRWVELAGLVEILEAHNLSRTLLAYLCLLLKGLSLEGLAVKLEPWRDHVDEELRGHLEAHA